VDSIELLEESGLFDELTDFQKSFSIEKIKELQSHFKSVSLSSEEMLQSAINLNTVFYTLIVSLAMFNIYFDIEALVSIVCFELSLKPDALNNIKDFTKHIITIMAPEK
jgi:hypothetical protein